MRYLGLDLGTKTLGLAISDKTNTLASPMKTIHYQEYDELIIELKKIIVENKITTLVLGLPINMNNSMGFASERSLEFGKYIKQNITIPLVYQDERLSTSEAHNILISNNSMRRNKRKKIVDSVAAMIILEGYLRKEKLKNGN